MEISQKGNLMTRKVTPILFSYLVMGFVDIVGVSTGYAKQDFDLDPGMAQLIPSMVFVWFFVLSVPVSLLQNKIGKRKVLLSGVLITAVGMFTPFLTYTYPVFLLSFVLLGIGNTFVQVSANPLLREVVSESKYAGTLSISQLVKAISSLLGPLLVALMDGQFGDWKLVFLIYGIVSLITAFWLMQTKINEQFKAESTGFWQCLKLLGNPFIAFMVLAIFLIVGIDVGMNTNIQTHLTAKFGLDLETASLGISLYFFSLMVSRFFGAILLNKVNHLKFLKWTGFATVGFFICLILSQNLIFTLVSIVLVGLASANLFPLIFALTVNVYPNRSNEISGLMTMAIVGGAVIPLLMGLSQKNFGENAGFIVLLISSIIVSVSYSRFAKLSETG